MCSYIPAQKIISNFLICSFLGKEKLRESWSTTPGFRLLALSHARGVMWDHCVTPPWASVSFFAKWGLLIPPLQGFYEHIHKSPPLFTLQVSVCLVATESEQGKCFGSIHVCFCEAKGEHGFSIK